MHEAEKLTAASPDAAARDEACWTTYRNAFRHTFSTENDEDVKTVQWLMRHANSNITMNIYTHFE
jgi:site-specific recombinase XerD